MSIEVQCHSGHRADERPLRFRLAERWIEVTRTVRQWREPETECFEVEGSDGKRYRLRRSLAADAWSI